MIRQLNQIHLVSNVAIPCLSSISIPMVYADTIIGKDANHVEKNDNTKPMYNLPLKSPHQSIIRFIVLNILNYYSFPDTDTAQSLAPI